MVTLALANLVITAQIAEKVSNLFNVLSHKIHFVQYLLYI